MKTLVLLCSACLLGALALPAGAQTKSLRGDIPFEFSVGGYDLPAGSYSIQLKGNVVRFMNDETGKSVAAILLPASTPSVEAQPAIEFHKYGDRAFLAGVRAEDGSHGLPQSEIEKQVSEDAAVASVRIVLASR